jgi:hypothetical protein
MVIGQGVIAEVRAQDHGTQGNFCHRLYSMWLVSAAALRAGGPRRRGDEFTLRAPPAGARCRLS